MYGYLADADLWLRYPLGRALARLTGSGLNFGFAFCGILALTAAWLWLGRHVIARTATHYTMVVTTGFWLAPLLLQGQIARVLGVDPLGPEGARRLALPGLELFTHGLFQDDSLLTAAKEALARPAGPRSDKGDGDPNQDPDPPAAR